MVLKEFSFISFIVFILLWVYLLLTEHLDQKYFLIACAGSIIYLVFAYNIETISKISVKHKNTEILAEMSRVRKDIYAKAEEVKSLGEQIAAIEAYTIARQGRYASDDSLKRRVEYRNKIYAFLNNMNSDPNDIERILEELDKVICFDLSLGYIKDISGKYVKLANRNQSSHEHEQCNKMNKTVAEIYNKYDLGNTKDELKAFIISQQLDENIKTDLINAIERGFQDCDWYRNHKTLK